MELDSSVGTAGNSFNPLPLNGVVNIPQQHQLTPLRTTGASSMLTDLIRSREFVIEFPRILTLDMSPAARTAAERSRREVGYFPSRIPERSQSSLSFVSPFKLTANDKLVKEQAAQEQASGSHSNEPIQHVLKTSVACGRHVNLHGAKSNTMKKRRSHSADGLYSHGYFARMELFGQRQQQQQAPPESWIKPTKPSSKSSNNIVNYSPIGSFNSIQVVGSDSGGNTIQPPIGNLISADEASTSQQRQRFLSTDLPIQIQINGEGIEF